MYPIGDERVTSYVAFFLGEEEYALSVDKVSSIVRYEPSMPVPGAPEGVEGVVNLRGTIVPVIDLMKRLRIGEFRPGPASRIVVAEGSAGKIGLTVDAASEVLAIPDAAIRPAPGSVLTPETTGVFSGVADLDGRMIILLELDAAVPEGGHTQDAVRGLYGED